MIYITGDTHGDFNRFSEENFPIQNEMTKEDFVIICGDFGGVWSYEENEYEKKTLDFLESRNFTILFVDGNHENFTRLYNFPVTDWSGGKVHKIRESVIHLIRGEVYNIDGKKVFAFGGARSHDIQDGIVNMDEEDKIYHLRKMCANFRIRDYNWWDIEIPTKEEMDRGLNNLKKVDFKVDYIVSHCAPTYVQAILGMETYKKDGLTDYLQGIYEKCKFKKWYFGHYYLNREVNDNLACLYENVKKVDFE